MEGSKGRISKHIAHNSLIFTKKENLSMNCDNLETLVVKIDNSKDKNEIANLVYRLPNGSIKTFHEYLKLFLDRTTIRNKNIVLIRDFNLNLQDFYQSRSVRM